MSEFKLGINDWTTLVHANAVHHGWWENGERNFGEICALITSEVSEAFEEHRNGHGPAVVYYTHVDSGAKSGTDFTPSDNQIANWKPEGISIELADVVIRIMDWFGSQGLDLEKAIEIKHAYNVTRPYKHGGKKA